MTADKTNDIASCNIICNNNIIGNIIICHVIPFPPPIQNARIIIVAIKKFIAPLNTTDNGNISLGKYTFFTILALPIIVFVDCIIVVVKKLQGINPTHTNIK